MFWGCLISIDRTLFKYLTNRLISAVGLSSGIPDVITLRITNCSSNGDNMLMAHSMNTKALWVIFRYYWNEERAGIFRILYWRSEERCEPRTAPALCGVCVHSACGIFTSTGAVMSSYSKLFDFLTWVCETVGVLVLQWMYRYVNTHGCQYTCTYAAIYKVAVQAHVCVSVCMFCTATQLFCHRSLFNNLLTSN